MKPCERGSISIYLLLVALLLALLAQLGLLCCRQMLEKSRQGLLKQQLRRLNNSYFLKLKDAELTPGDYLCFEGVLQPGQEVVTVKATSSQSSDGLINFLEVKGTAANHAGAVQRLCQITLDFADTPRAWAGQYALVSRTAEGLEYLQQEGLYIQASKEEVQLPAVDFLNKRATGSVTAAEAANEGLNKHFTYLASDTGFAFTRGSTLAGETTFVNRGSITINANCVFPDRVALYSQKNSITIGNNVRMDKALVHAYGTVTIGAGCRINGLIIANKIILKGESTFSADGDVVAPFTSCAFTN